MTTIFTRTLTLASFFGCCAAASAQGDPVVYPSFLPSADQVIVTGQLDSDVTAPGNSDSCSVSIYESLMITNSTALSVGGSSGCLARAVSIMDAGADSCIFGGVAEVVPQATGAGAGVAYEVDGTQTSLHVAMRSKHFLSAEVSVVVPGDGGTTGISTADFSTTMPVVMSVPFAISHDGSLVIVLPGDSALSRQAGTLSGMSTMSWRIVEDTNRNGLIDPGEGPEILSGGEGAILGSGFRSNDLALVALIDRGLYVLETTLQTEAGASAMVECFNAPNSSIQSDTEDVAMRLNLSFI